MHYNTGQNIGQELPQEYWEIKGNLVILKPGAPAQIIALIRTDLYSPGPVYENHVQMDSAEDAQAYIDSMQGIKFRMSAAQPNIQANINLRFDNDGAGAGNVKVKVFKDGQLMREEIISVKPFVTSNVDSGFRPAFSGGTLDIEVTMPDGSVQYLSADIHALSRSNSRNAARESVRLAGKIVGAITGPLAGLYSGTTIAAQLSQGGAVTAANVKTVTETLATAIAKDMMGPTPEERQKEIDKLYKQIADAQAESAAWLASPEGQLYVYGKIVTETKGKLEGIGGTEIPLDNTTMGKLNQAIVSVASENPNEVMNRTVSLYKPVAGEMYPKISDMYVDTDTVAGRIAMGLYQNAWAGDENYTMRLVASVAQVVGIDPMHLYQFARNKSDPGRLFQGMKYLFSQAGFGAVFSRFSVDFIERGSGILVTTDETSYTAGSVRIAFSPAVGKTVDHARVYVTNGSKQQVFDPISTPELRGRLSYAMPLKYFGLYSQSDAVRIKVAVWYTDGTTEGGYSDVFSVHWDGKEAIGSDDLSTNPDPAMRTKESLILKDLAFPLPLTEIKDGKEVPLSWSYDMVSSPDETYHQGHGKYALDINIPGSTDKDKPVSVAAEGKIIKADLSQGLIIMEHTLPDGTKWQTEYVHMTHILEGLTGKAYLAPKEAGTQDDSAARQAAQAAIDKLKNDGTVIPLGTALGKVGTEGDSTGYHLHFQINVGASPVDLSHWIDSKIPGFTVHGEIQGKGVMEFHWNPEADALANAAERIAMKRVDIVTKDKDGKDVVTGVENLAFAWETGKSIEQMTRVVWKSIKYVNSEGVESVQEQWMKISDLPVAANSKIKLWINGNWSDATFISLL